uniref:Uncharacterized protein n=1 Tax=Compsopogon caeruleus TaxID=31354 RepID=A0A7S1THH4_9RHOD
MVPVSSPSDNMIQTDIAKIGIHSKAKNSQYNSANNLPNNNACVILKEDLGRGKGGATVTLPPKDWLQAHHLPPLLLRHHMALERNPQESSLRHECQTRTTYTALHTRTRIFR